MTRDKPAIFPIFSLSAKQRETEGEREKVRDSRHKRSKLMSLSPERSLLCPSSDSHPSSPSPRLSHAQMSIRGCGGFGRLQSPSIVRPQYLQISLPFSPFLSLSTFSWQVCLIEITFPSLSSKQLVEEIVSSMCNAPSLPPCLYFLLFEQTPLPLSPSLHSRQ